MQKTHVPKWGGWGALISTRKMDASANLCMNTHRYACITELVERAGRIARVMAITYEDGTRCITLSFKNLFLLCNKSGGLIQQMAGLDDISSDFLPETRAHQQLPCFTTSVSREQVVLRSVDVLIDQCPLTINASHEQSARQKCSFRKGKGSPIHRLRYPARGCSSKKPSALLLPEP